MSAPSVRLASPSEMLAVLAVRTAVFVDEQGVAPAIEQDGRDAQADHVVAVVDGAIVGTARIVYADRAVAVIGRVAVLPEYRSRGIGAAIMAGAERLACRHGCAIVELHAQSAVRGFYDRLGYASHGTEYLEAGIPHVTMRKSVVVSG